ncbi:MAG TPA: ABC transporter ATP-binding protein [Candidatus Paceibacterota bacterium]|jgi:putative ABC transport system ATP-binding protein
MALFEAIDLEKTYPGDVIDTKVLHGLTFTIERGEFVSIMGPSGSGKSTLLHILGFLDKSTGGTYRFNGKRYEDYGEADIARTRNKEMGFVFQAFNLLPRASVYDNVALPLMYSDVPEREWQERITRVIERVGLSHRTHFEAYKLSGGEKQRVAIARALVNEPDVIFADEPTGNLDSKSGQAVMETLQRLHDEFGHTIVLITHETSTAEHAERILMVRDGHIVSDEPVVKRRQATEAFSK